MSDHIFKCIYFMKNMKFFIWISLKYVFTGTIESKSVNWESGM